MPQTPAGRQPIEGEPVPRWKSTRTLIAAAVALWATDAVLAAVMAGDALRSISQGIAVTISVFAGMAWLRERERERRMLVSTPDGARYVRAVVPASDDIQITMEIPRVKLGIPAQHVPADEHFPPGTAAKIYEICMKTAEKRFPRS